eukprot:316239_1
MSATNVTFADNKEWESENNEKKMDPDKPIIVENALVAIIGISKYDGENAKPYYDLPAVVTDVRIMKELWEEYFQYTVLALDPNKKISYNYLYNNFIGEVQKKLFNAEKRRYDALIICLFGHGWNEGILTSDKQLYTIKLLEKHFSPTAMPFLAKTLRLFIIHLCRGNKIPKDIDETKYRGDDDDELKTVHEDSHMSFIYSNTAGFRVEDNEIFAKTIKKVMEESNLCKHDLNSIVNMVGKKVALAKPLLCVEHVSRQKQLIYFKRNYGKHEYETYSDDYKHVNSNVNMPNENQALISENHRQRNAIRQSSSDWWSYATPKCFACIVGGFTICCVVVVLVVWLFCI